MQLTVPSGQDEGILLGHQQQRVDLRHFQAGPVRGLTAPQLLAALLEDLCPEPGLHLPIPRTEQLAIGGDHAVDGPLMSLEGQHRLLTFFFGF